MQKLKEKRKAALDARLAKVRERKLKKMGQAGEAGEPGEQKEKNESTGVAEPTAEELVKETSSDREEKDEKLQYRLPEKKAQIPEWATHKISKCVFCFMINSTPSMDGFTSPILFLLGCA